MRTFNLLSSQSICEQLGGRVKLLRLARNLSQQQLAEMTQSSLSSVRRLEADGQGSLDFVVRIAQALQVVDQLNDWFVQPALSIADAERAQVITQRQRARSPRVAKKVA
ncbi:MAG: XRE family transcriptional regulator [Burkholderiales bacterium]|nr:MAG: XRE family transcriptional regulator [Burkholderiales bacterium]